MKLLIIYLILGVAAVGAGIGSAHLYHNSVIERTDEAFYSNQWEISDPTALEAQAIITPGILWDAGTIDPSKEYSHDFVVTNKGTKTLQIWISDKSAGPVNVELGTEKIEIGLDASYPITVRFKGSEIKEKLDTEIVVSTNQADDEPIKLRVRGQVQQ